MIQMAGVDTIGLGESVMSGERIFEVAAVVAVDEGVDVVEEGELIWNWNQQNARIGSVVLGLRRREISMA